MELANNPKLLKQSLLELELWLGISVFFYQVSLWDLCGSNCAAELIDITVPFLAVLSHGDPSSTIPS